jgi:hypothetical protein
MAWRGCARLREQADIRWTRALAADRSALATALTDQRVTLCNLICTQEADHGHRGICEGEHAGPGLERTAGGAEGSRRYHDLQGEGERRACRPAEPGQDDGRAQARRHRDRHQAGQAETVPLLHVFWGRGIVEVSGIDFQNFGK